jgi:hypothetical protein
MARKTRWVLALLVVAAAVVGCSGFSDDQATARCNQEQTAHAGGACFDHSSMTSCTTAFKDCGESTVINEAACPITYSCP